MTAIARPQNVAGDATSMSRITPGIEPASQAKPLESLGIGQVARRVHQLRNAVLSSLTTAVVPVSLAACVVPPSLNSEENDAGVNHPPVIHQVRDGTGAVLPRPGPLTFVVGAGEINIDAADTDLGDTLYARLYLQYGLPTATQFLVACEAAPGAKPTIERTITCPLFGLCTDTLTDGKTRVFEVDVLDREPISTPNRQYRDVTPPGEVSSFWWNLECVAP